MNTQLPRRLAGPVGPLLCALLLATAGCSFSPGAARNAAPAGHVTVTTQVSVLPGQGYAWVPLPASTAPEQDARVQDEQFRAGLQTALDRALQAKGYRPVDRAGAAFLVAHRVGVRDLRETQPVRAEQPAGTTPMAAIKCTGGSCSQLVVSNESGEPVLRYRTTERTEGGLLIEVIEPGSIRVVWRALNTGTVRPGEWTQERLDAVAAQTLADLPPYRP